VIALSGDVEGAPFQGFSYLGEKVFLLSKIPPLESAFQLGRTFATKPSS
jgi:hypothetical protein